MRVPARAALLACVLATAGPRPALSEPPTAAVPPGEPERPPAGEPLTLARALELALARNPELEVERLSPRIAGEAVARARSAFDPSASASFRDGDERTASTSSLAGAPILQQRSSAYAGGLKERLPTGTSLDLSLSYVRQLTNSAFSTLNPSHTAGTTLTVRQPLLKGFGLGVNRADLASATHRRDAARHAFEARVAGTVAAVEAAYWDLAAALDDVAVKQAALEAARALEASSQARAEAGTAAGTEVLEASSASASREADLIDAERRSADAQDRLRQMVDPAPPSAGPPAPYLPLERPVDPGVQADLEAGIGRALQNRPELAQARAALQAALVSRMAAGNALLPDLSLTGVWGQEGVDADRDDAFSRLSDGRTRRWELGLSVEMPLGNRAARSDLRRAEAEVAQETARLRALEQAVVVEVRAAARALEGGRRRIEAGQRAVALSSERLRAELLRFQQGLSATHAVLEAMKVDTAERGRLLAARVDLLKAATAWHRAQATLLEARGIVLE